ncbi:AraC family transcriptional regulator [Streptomyces sp. NBC_01478]|uniref:AraC family transcriptional regulator n=1 Tax=Streptomyces sp. NBC_01478 TaxID=2903882 RepID=UPI002E36519C|nr:AraC family transcriptional regulator [Streptomyces sp. NBC_01478]
MLLLELGIAAQIFSMDPHYELTGAAWEPVLSVAHSGLYVTGAAGLCALAKADTVVGSGAFALAADGSSRRKGRYDPLAGVRPASNARARLLVAPPQRPGGQAQYTDQLRSRPSSQELATVRDWMLDNMAAPITVDDLAAHACMARRTLVRRYREETGTSPMAWLADARIDRAPDRNRESSVYACGLPQTCRDVTSGVPRSLPAEGASGRDRLSTSPTACSSRECARREAVVVRIRKAGSRRIRGA